MTSPAHQAALGFLRGGLIAVAALAITTPLGAMAASLFQWGWLAEMVRWLLPLTGFALGGAVGGEALGLGSRGAIAFGCGGGAAGLALQLTAANLQGLTGFEDPLTVVAYGVLSAGAGFGATGVIASLIVGRRGIPAVTAGFAVGGAIGGLLGVVPFLVQHAHAAWPPEVMMFTSLACSIGAVVLPFMAGGIVAARQWG
jgi:hypothetical protein